MDLTIGTIELKKVKAPLKQPFITHLQTVKERTSLIVKVYGSAGGIGYGECTAFDTPWYTEETIVSCEFVLSNVLIPMLEGKTFSHPSDVFSALAAVKGNRMAKAAVETACWDLFAKLKGEPLWKTVGGTKQIVPAGVVAAADPKQLPDLVKKAAEDGYRRVKLKINTQTDPSFLRSIISEHPDLLFFADANGAFTEETFDDLVAFDKCGFLLIEQPFGELEWTLHAKAKAAMQTTICLDESISSVEDAVRMIETEAGDAAVLKMSRLGGWTETLNVYELFHKHRIDMWVGGMIEFGVSKAHNLALASLPAIQLPGDFSASRHFWEKDIIKPEIKLTDGCVFLSTKPGIGYEVIV